MVRLGALGAPAGARVYPLAHPELPKNTNIVCIPAAQKILYNPLVCGRELRRLSLECSKSFLKTAWAMVPGLKKLGTREISELVVLRGSLGYQFDVAFEELFDRYLPRCFVGARRYRISGGEFGADIFYTNFEALPDAGVVFTGDTIATGISLSHTLAELRSELRRRDLGIKKLLVFSIAASLKGCKRLREWEERFREWWPGFKLYLFTAEGLFGLADNGTDLLFRREGEVVLPEESKRRVSRVYGEYGTAFLPGNICAIFDWGDRNFKPERHLEDLLRFAKRSLETAEDKKSKEVLRRLALGAKRGLAELNQRLPAPR